MEANRAMVGFEAIALAQIPSRGQRGISIWNSRTQEWMKTGEIAEFRVALTTLNLNRDSLSLGNAHLSFFI